MRGGSARCPVLDVPAWFFEALDLHYRLSSPGLPALDWPFEAVRLADHVAAATMQAEAAHAETKRKQDDLAAGAARLRPGAK